jgi:uncharacterized protein YndB with AHSA1/START domain
VKRTGQASAYVDAPPDDVFAIITDLVRLPAWNRRVARVVEMPETLAEDAEWVVQMDLMKKRFHSRSHVIELDAQERRFAYRSKREDDNPSFTVWTWEVVPEGPRGSRVTLSWELRPVTFVRKHLVSRVRDRQIRTTEAPASLAALAAAVAARPEPRRAPSSP